MEIEIAGGVIDIDDAIILVSITRNVTLASQGNGNCRYFCRSLGKRRLDRPVWASERPVLASGLDGKSGLAPLGNEQNASTQRPDVVQKASGEKINGEWAYDGQNTMKVLNIDASSGWSDASMSEDEDEEDWDAESFYSATSKETKLSSTQDTGTNANEGFSLQLNILRKLVLEEDCAVNTIGASTAEGPEVPACYKFLDKIERINKLVAGLSPTSKRGADKI